MNQIRDKLRKAIAEQRRPRPERPGVAGNAQIEAAFRPVAHAAGELREELSHVPGLTVVVEPGQVLVDLYDRHLWFGYSTEKRQFVGSELSSQWMEGGFREEHFAWDTAEACIDAMIQACARYVSLAEIVASFKPG